MSNYIDADICRVLHKQSFLGSLVIFVALFVGLVFICLNPAFTAICMSPRAQAF